MSVTRFPKRRRTRKDPPTPQPEERIGLVERLMLEHLRKVGECTIDDSYGESRDSRLLPPELGESLNMVTTLALIGMAVRNSCRVHRVPASFLIALHVAAGGWQEVPTEMSDRYPGERYFLKLARSLTARKYRAALKLASSPVRYAHRLFELGFVESKFRLFDICDLIVRHSLFECDWLYSGEEKNIPGSIPVEKAAKMLGLTVDAVRELIQSGQIQTIINEVSYGSAIAFEQRRSRHEIEAALANEAGKPAKFQAVAPVNAGIPAEPLPGSKLLAFPGLLVEQMPAAESLQ